MKRGKKILKKQKPI